MFDFICYIVSGVQKRHVSVKKKRHVEESNHRYTCACADMTLFSVADDAGQLLSAVLIDQNGNGGVLLRIMWSTVTTPCWRSYVQ